MLKKLENSTLENTYQEFLRAKHHAFLIKTNQREQIFNYWKSELATLSNSAHENYFLYLQVFDIEKARNLIAYARLAFTDQHYLVISFFSINHEAENAILKLLEETNPNIKILLIVDLATKLLPTILSRVYKLDSLVLNDETDVIIMASQKFLASKKVDRMNLSEIKEILDKKDKFALEEENKERGDREIVEIFLTKLYEIFFVRYETSILKEDREVKKSQKYIEFLEDILLALKYIKNNSSSSKTILEYLALKLPVLTFSVEKK